MLLETVQKMNAKEAVNYIESNSWSRTKLGLERTRELLEKLGDPQKKLKFVHVAGTNGKGSTCAMLASVLRSAGYRTGLYTSPYICRFNERMQVNGEEIADGELAEITEKVKPIAEAMDDHPSQFEIVTAIAMLYFLREECDIVVLEVGMGGISDATNVIDTPECAVITTIGLDHTEYLGTTLSQIAYNKAGIIKSGCPVVCFRGSEEVEAVFEKTAAEKGAYLTKADFDAIKPVSDSLEGQTFSFRNHKALSLPLLGAHQLKNAAVVLETVEILQKRGWKISENDIRRGLAEVRWPARFELMRKAPPFVIDGAHNPQCAEALADALEKYLSGKQNVFLIGVLADKEYDKIIALLRPYAKNFLCVTPDSPRALPANALAEYLRSLGEEAASFRTIDDGVRAAASCGLPVVACGSLYMAGHVRETFIALSR